MIGRDLRWKKFAWILIPLFAIGFFWQPILRGQVLIPGDILGFVDPAWSTTAKPQNGLLSDVLFQFYPWQNFLFDRVRHGELPLWNPHQLAGTPFLANDQSGVFDPIRFLSLAAGWSAAGSFLPMAVLRLSLFGLGTWLFLRRRNFSPGVAVVAGLMAMMTAPSIVWLSYPLFSVMAWLPLMLYSIDRIRDRHISGILLLALATAGQFFGGNIQMSLFLMVTVMGYALWAQKTSWSVIGRFALGFLLGTMIAGAQLLPTLSFVRQSQQFESGRRGYATTSFFSAVKNGKWLGWTSLHDVRVNIEKTLPLLAPTVHGNPTSHNYRFVAADPNNNYNELASSIGVMGLILALFGLVTHWRDRLVRWIGGCSVLAFGVVIHAPVFELVNYLPIINRTDTERLKIMVAWGLVVLAAYGLQALLLKRDKKTTIIFMCTTAVMVGFYAAVMVAFGLRPLPMTEIVTVLISGLALVAARFMQKKYWLSLGLAGAATLLVPVMIFHSYNPSVSQGALFPENKVTAAVKNLVGQDGRVAGFLSSGSHAPLRPNSGLVTGLDDIRGYEVVRLPRFDALTKNIFTKSGSYLMGVSGYSPILDLLSVRVLIMTDADATKYAPEFLDHGWIDAAPVPGLHLLANPRALPRAYIATAVTEVDSAGAALQAVTASNVVPQIPVLETGRTASAATGPEIVAAPIIDSTANTQTIRVGAVVPGYLVTTDAYTSDWQVTVDGRKGQTIPADYALRAVAVPAGFHTIVWRYNPRAWRIGVWLSIAGLIMTGFIFGWRYSTFKNRGLFKQRKK